MTRKTTRRRNGWGAHRQLASGRWQASYTHQGRRFTAPATFAAKVDADAWLTRQRAAILAGTWADPREVPVEPTAPLTLGQYLTTWLDVRDLKPRTRAHYEWLYETRIKPTFADVPLADLTRDMVRTWYADLDRSKATTRAHAYGLLRTVIGSAVEDGLIPAQVAHIRGAGAAKRKSQTTVLEASDVAALADAMPARLRPMILLAAWCGLRFGELVALTADDVDLDAGTVSVNKAVVRVGGTPQLSTTKSDAGTRVVAIPPHVVKQLRGRLAAEGLLFPASNGKYLQPSTFNRHYYRARDAIGRPDLRFHDLRHTGLTLAAIAGATLADLMARAGHSTATAALKYQHQAQGRDKKIAKALSKLSG